MMKLTRKQQGVTAEQVKRNVQDVERAVRERGGNYYRVTGATVVDGNLIQTIEMDNGEKAVAVFRSYGTKDERVEVQDWAG